MKYNRFKPFSTFWNNIQLSTTYTPRILFIAEIRLFQIKDRQTLSPLPPFRSAEFAMWWNERKINFLIFVIFIFWSYDRFGSQFSSDQIIFFLQKCFFYVNASLLPPFLHTLPRGFRPQAPDSFGLNPLSELVLEYNWLGSQTPRNQFIVK